MSPITSTKNGFRPASIVLAACLAGVASLGIGQPPAGQPAPVSEYAQTATSTDGGSLPANFSTGDRASDGANTRPQAGSAGDMIGFSSVDGSGTQTITLIHTGKSWMAVYHIDRSGKIRLVSSRPIDADFSLQLNATSPLPEEIREIGRH